MKKILIVDDDADDRDLFCEALAEVAPDCNCFTAPNGRRALMALGDQEIPLPDIVFMDVNMPLMHGWQCLTVLKETEAYQHIPVIMYSTSSHEEEVEKAQRLGALCFFTKPAQFKELKRNLVLVMEHFQNGTMHSLAESSPLFRVAIG